MAEEFRLTAHNDLQPEGTPHVEITTSTTWANRYGNVHKNGMFPLDFIAVLRAPMSKDARPIAGM